MLLLLPVEYGVLRLILGLITPFSTNKGRVHGAHGAFLWAGQRWLRGA